MKTKDAKNTPKGKKMLSEPSKSASSTSGLKLGAALPGAVFGTAYALGAQEMGGTINAMVSPVHRDAAPVANGDFDSMKFDEAFEAARAQVGPGGLFPWHGQVHSTYTPEEWDSLDRSLRSEFETMMASANVQVPEYGSPQNRTYIAMAEVGHDEPVTEVEVEQEVEVREDDDYEEVETTLIAQAEIEPEGGYGEEEPLAIGIATEGDPGDIGNALAGIPEAALDGGVELYPEDTDAPLGGDWVDDGGL